MKFANEKEFTDFMRGKHVKEHGKPAEKAPVLTPEPQTVKGGGKNKGKIPEGNIRLILPFKLPTWNQLLAMNPWERNKVAKWIKGQVSACIVSGAEWQTPTGSAVRLRLTDLCLQEYYQMIVPDTSKRFRLHKKKVK